MEFQTEGEAVRLRDLAIRVKLKHPGSQRSLAAIADVTDYA